MIVVLNKWAFALWKTLLWGFILGLFSLPELFAQEPAPKHQLMVSLEPYLGMETGATNLHTLHGLFSRVESPLFQRILFEQEDTFLKRSYGIVLRLTKVTFVDLQLAGLCLLVQHEYFGHAARLRELGMDYKWHISPLPPYGKGKGWVRYQPYYHRSLTMDESLIFTTAGSEANSEYAYVLQKSFFRKRTASYWELLTYLVSKNDISNYILRSTRAESAEDFGKGDVERYIININSKYNIYRKSDYPVGTKTLKQAVIYNLIDPMQWIALFNILYSHIVKGQTDALVPMLHLSKVKFFPGTRFYLTPFGHEYFLDAYLKMGGRNYTAYVRIGDDAFDTFWGGGCSVDEVYHSQMFKLGVRCDLWWQPELTDKETFRILPGVAESSPTKHVFGFHLRVNFSLALSTEKSELGNFIGYLGYKTHGFVPGLFFSRHFYYAFGLLVNW